MNVLFTQMLAKADPSQVEGLSRFFKTGPGQYGEGDKFLGIKVTVTRGVVKDYWRETGVPELEECISSEYHEVRLAALLALVEIYKRSNIKEECIRFYLYHTQYINNWDLVDLSCYPLLGEWLLDKDRSLLYDLARNGKTVWEQRIGIVSTMTFIRHGQLEDTYSIADILLHHHHDLIHKAVGWLLREAGKRDTDALIAFLKGTPEQAGCVNAVYSGTDNPVTHSQHNAFQQPRYLQMPRTMLRYAIEKFPEAERRVFLAR